MSDSVLLNVKCNITYSLFIICFAFGEAYFPCSYPPPRVAVLSTFSQLKVLNFDECW